MRSFCVYRVTIDSPVISSVYDFETGLIDGVPESKFKFVMPKLYKDFYDVPKSFGLKEDMTYYHTALNMFSGLFAVNCYDVGFFVASADKFCVFLKNTWYPKDDGGVILPEENIFRFNSHLIGSYKTVVEQLDATQSFVGIYVDDDGVFISRNGSVQTPFKHDVDPERVAKCKSVSAWRRGMDGVIVDESGKEIPYKISNKEIILERGE